jgi:hypothetical protein
LKSEATLPALEALAMEVLDSAKDFVPEGKLGKRLSFFCQVVLLVGGVTGGLLATPDPAREPVFVYLHADITDHVNLDLSEDRLRHFLPMIEKYRKEHPQAHVSATVLFSGASSDALAQRNSQTHIVDFVKGYIQRGVIEVGYDGADEPTYQTRPMIDLSNARTVDARWTVRANAAENLLSEARDPLTGKLVPGKSGGLKRMQEVFGEAAYVTGLAPLINTGPQTQTRAVLNPTNGVPPAPEGTGAPAKYPVPTIVPDIGVDSEIVREVRHYNTKAIMLGLPEDNPAQIAGFGGGEEGVAKLLSPADDTSPEVYWQDNVLRLSEVSNTSEAAEEAEGDYHGLTAEETKKDFGDLNRSRIQVVRVELADERYYLQHAFTKDDEYALKYAYDHPEDPKLPAGARLTPAEVEAAYTREQATLQWLAEEFFAANQGSRFVSNADLRKMAAPSKGYAVSMDGLRAGLKDLLEVWGNNTFPPAFVRADGRYLSLADAFQVMTDALSELDRTGKLPASVRVAEVWGPEHTAGAHGPNVGEVTPAEIAHVCSGLVDRLHDNSAGTVPKNSIPALVTVAGINMNSAQFLRLMAAALLAPSSDTKLRVKMTYMYPAQAQLVPKTRIMSEMGGSWTVKPAQLEIGSLPPSAQPQK